MKKLLIIPILFSGISLKPNDDVKALATCVGVAGVSYVAYKIYKWASYKDARKLVTNAQMNLESCRSRYSEMLDIISHYYSANEQISRNGHKNVKEAALHALSLCIIEESAMYTCDNIKCALKDISRIKSALDKKRKLVIAGKDIDNTFDKTYVDNLLVELDVLIGQLSFLNKYLKEHKSYFDLIKAGKKVAENDYAAEISTFNSIPYDLNYQIVCCGRAKLSNSDYPLMEYVDNIKADLNTLESLQKRLSYNYFNLIKYIADLESYLKETMKIVTSSNELAQEKRDKKNEELKKERLKIEQEKLKAEERKASAEERKARAEEQKARAKEAQANAERQRSRAQLA